MPERVGIRELRERLTSKIRRVRAGETFEVTHHGEPVAVLAPIQADRIARLAAGPDITPGKPLTRPLRRFPVTTDTSASDAIEEDRAER